MPNINQSTANVLTLEKLGIRVDGATKTLPASTTQTVFTVSGGSVLVTGFLATVTTVIQAQANAMKYSGHYTSGTDVDLCTTVETNAAEVGASFVLPALVTSALQKALSGANNLPACSVVLKAGSTILQNCAATNTGSIQHTLWYIPLDPGAAVAAN